MEMTLSGEVFAKTEMDYEADAEGKWAAGTSRKATILNFDNRDISYVRFRGAEGQIAYARLSVDEHVDIVVRPNVSGGKLVLDYVRPASPVSAVKATDKPA